MFRRIISLLLLPGVMLTQSAAALSHNHGDEEPPGHGLRPHIHAHCGSIHHDRVHHRHDAEDADAKRVAAENYCRLGDPDPLSKQQHDSDATYVTHLDSVVPQRTTTSDVLAASLLDVFAGPQVFTTVPDGPSPQAIDPTHRAPPPGYDCPLYIWQLVLLI